jgi:hypothetical protein
LEFLEWHPELLVDSWDGSGKFLHFSLVIFWDNAYFLKIRGKLTVLESNGLL